MFYIPGFPPGVKWLLIGNVAIFVIGYFSGLMQLYPFKDLWLIPAEVLKEGRLWELATYLFLHGGISHILWNMLALWMFGADLEGTWGTRRFLQFYFFCGVGAGICVVLANYLLPWGNPRIPTIGSSGAIFGILMAYAMLYPTRTILFSFLIPIQVKYFVMIIGAIAFLSSFQVNNGVSEFAHLGGLLFGYVFLKTPKFNFDLAGPVRHQYSEWKLRRAKKKFQVYLRKQGSGRDPRVH
ncbi:MAG: rhomboid family intramembrane serine protease [Bryobacteraceae bacterium]|jgi:membrane associated rhomboid family serine protease